MTAIERTAYPRFKQSLTDEELNRFYTPLPEEIELAYDITDVKMSRLAFLVLLKAFQKLGYLPKIDQVPHQIKIHIAQKIGQPFSKRKLGNLSSSTRDRYRQSIYNYLQVRSYNDGGNDVVIQIVSQTVPTMSDPADLINVAIEELIRQQYELPTYPTLDERVNHIRHQIHLRLYRQIMSALSLEQIEILDSLLKRDIGQTRYPYNRLKSLPKSASLNEVRRWQKHLDWLENLMDTQSLLANLTNTKVEQFASEALQLETGDMLNIEIKERRYTLLLCLVYHMQVRTRDQLTTMFLRRIHLWHNNAKARLRAVHDQYRALSEKMVVSFSEVVHQAIEVEKLTDEGQDKDALLGKHIHRLLQANGGTKKLEEECSLLQAYHDNNYLPLLQIPYRKKRAVPFHLTKQLKIHSVTQSQAIIQALDFIHKYRHKKVDHTPAEISIDFASPRWRSLIKEKIDGEIMYNKYHLEMCVFSYVHDHLRNGDLYVIGSETYADYRTQLLAWSDCKPLLKPYCQAVGLPATATGFVDSLRKQLTELAHQVDMAHTPANDLYFDENGKPHLRQLSRLPEPEQAEALEKIMQSRMPERHLLDILHNVHHWIGYTRHFGPPSGSDPKLQDPISRYLITIFSYGCNMGPAQTARHARTLASERVIGRLNAQHITSDKLDAAMSDVINEYVRFPIPFLWGTGKSSVADGTHYELRENNLLGERHIRYGGYGGIAYHHISDTYVALFSRFIACGVWEAVYILDGLLQNKSVLQPDTVHADTHGQSAVVFGLSHLLGIKLMPRMRNWNKVAMYRSDSTISYKNIDTWFTRIVDWQLIETYWQDLMQIILSIHTGKVLPSWLLQKLRTDNPKNKLYQAFRELGCVMRTLFLLKYVSDPIMRREIRAATTKIESYNEFSGWIYFGGDGIIKSRDPVEYEKRIKYKDLIANAIMLQNVVDMTDVLHEMTQEGIAVTEEVVATFSPYLTKHIKRFGEYFIDLDSIPPPLQPDKPFLVTKQAVKN